MRLLLHIAASLVLCLFLFWNPAEAQENPTIRQKARLEWSNIEAASGYIIEIRQGGTRILKAETSNNFYEANLPHGVYQFRVSVLNKENKIEARTGWKTVKVQSWSIVGRKYQFVGAGWSYNTLLPYWNERVTYSPLNGHLFYEYELPQLNFLGIEGIVEYETFNNIKKSNEVKRDLAVWSFAPGLCFYTKMSEYFDGLFHIDGGLTYTTMSIDDRGDKTTVTSVDFFAAGSLGIRFTYDMYFLEHGIGYKQIFYRNEPFREFRPYIRAGLRF
ncbi:MAG: hypothetical protein ACOC2H_00805 [Spirochaetota bacterium]